MSLFKSKKETDLLSGDNSSGESNSLSTAKAMKKPSKKKKLIIGVAVLLVGAIGVQQLFFANKQAALSLATSKIEQGNIDKIISINGQVKGSDAAEVSSGLNFEMIKINVKEGDVVNKGDILGVLDSKSLQSDYDMAVKDLAISQAQLKEQQSTAALSVKERQVEYNEAKRQNEIQKSLFQSGGISNDEMTQSNITLEKAAFALEAAKDNFNRASASGSAGIGLDVKREIVQSKKENLEKAQIKSPINGTVTRVNAKIGRIPTAADQAKALFIVENLEDLVIDVTVSEYDISRIKLGQKVKITSDVLTGKTLEGEVSRIAPTGETTTGSTSKEMRIPVQIKVLHKNPSFIAGVNAKAEILVDAKKDILIAPLESILTVDGKKYILVGNDNVIKRVPVETGIENLTSVEVISSDIKAGDTIINQPSADYTDGQSYTNQNQE